MTHRALSVTALTALSSLAAAQQQPADCYWLNNSSVQEALHKFSDIDGDGLYLTSPDEASYLFYDQTVPAGTTSPQDLVVRSEGGVPTVYWVDTVLDQVLRGQDLNGTGEVELAEMTVFRDSVNLDGGSSPDAVEVTDDGAVWWCSDGSAHVGLFRLFDGNGDGDANDAGEQEIMVDGNGGGHTVTWDNGAGSGPVDIEDIRSIASAGNGVVVYEDGNGECMYRFEDLNGDGDVLDTDESILFFNGSGKNGAFPLSGDAGTLPSLVVDGTTNCSPALTFQAYIRFSYIASCMEGGNRAYYMASEAGPNSCFGTNVDQESVNFIIFRGEDLNADRDINDAGEVTLFYDGSATSANPTQLGTVLGIGALDGGHVYVSDLNGGGDRSIHRFLDGNADGNASGVGEQDLFLFQESAWPAGDPFPFGYAFVLEMAVSDRGLFEVPTFAVSGTGCTFLGGPNPVISGTGTGAQGTPFTINLDDAAPNLPAIPWWGTSTATWAGVPLPLDLTIIDLPGCFLYHNIINTAPLQVTNPAGHADFTFNVPTQPIFSGFPLPWQWLVIEPISEDVQLSNLGVLNIP